MKKVLNAKERRNKFGWNLLARGEEKRVPRRKWMTESSRKAVFFKARKWMVQVCAIRNVIEALREGKAMNKKAKNHASGQLLTGFSSS
jgi:hypothetical protein